MSAAAGDVPVWVTEGTVAATVDRHADACALSPAQARRVAAALLVAADRADGREPEPWDNLVTWWLNARHADPVRPHEPSRAVPLDDLQCRSGG